MTRRARRVAVLLGGGGSPVVHVTPFAWETCHCLVDGVKLRIRATQINKREILVCACVPLPAQDGYILEGRTVSASVTNQKLQLVWQNMFFKLLEKISIV